MNGSTRSGLVTVCILVCLMIATSLAIVAMQSALRERRQIGLRHQVLQTEFLLDAGIRRALRKLKESAAYQGETWQPRTDSSTYPNPTVQIRRIGDERVDVIASLGVPPKDLNRISASVTQRSYSLFLQTLTNTNSNTPVSE